MIKKIIERMKFEQVLVLILIAILTVVMFYFGKINPEILNFVLGAIVGAFTTYTKQAVTKDKDENK